MFRLLPSFIVCFVLAGCMNIGGHVSDVTKTQDMGTVEETTPQAPPPVRDIDQPEANSALEEIIPDSTFMGVGEFSLTTDYGTNFSVYASGPEDATHAVILVPDYEGFDQALKNWADILSEQGFRVLAVDLFDGRHADTSKSGLTLYREIDPVWIEADIKAAIDYLTFSGARVAMIGFGVGSQAVLAGSLADSEHIDAIGLVYGVWPGKLPDFKRLVPPVLSLYPEKVSVTSDEEAKLELALWEAEVDLIVRRYPTSHGFMHSGNESFDSDVAEKAWSDMLSFLRDKMFTEE